MKTVVSTLVAFGLFNATLASAQTPERSGSLLVGTVGEGAGPHFDNLSEVHPFEDGLLVVDSGAETAYVINGLGEVVFETGGAGDGPGEFRVLVGGEVCADGFTWLFDPTRLGLTRVQMEERAARRNYLTVLWDDLSIAGRAVGFDCSQSADVLAVSDLGDDRPAPSSLGGQPRGRVSVRMLSSSGTPIGVLTGIPWTETYFDGSSDFPRPFGMETSLAVGHDRVFVGSGGESAFTAFSFDGEHIARADGPASSRAVTSEVIGRFVDQRVTDLSGMVSAGEVREYYRDMEFPDRAPAYRKVLAGPTLVWVERYPLGGLPVWHRFTPDGDFVDEVELEAGFQLTAITDEYLFGIQTDDLGVDFARRIPR